MWKQRWYVSKSTSLSLLLRWLLHFVAKLHCVASFAVNAIGTCTPIDFFLAPTIVDNYSQKFFLSLPSFSLSAIVVGFLRWQKGKNITKNEFHVKLSHSIVFARESIIQTTWENPNYQGRANYIVVVPTKWGRPYIPSGSFLLMKIDIPNVSYNSTVVKQTYHQIHTPGHNISFYIGLIW